MSHRDLPLEFSTAYSLASLEAGYSSSVMGSDVDLSAKHSVKYTSIAALANSQRTSGDERCRSHGSNTKTESSQNLRMSRNRHMNNAECKWEMDGPHSHVPDVTSSSKRTT